MTINLGLLGAASITPRSVITPARKLDNITISGIASSDIMRAMHFADNNDIPHVFADYSSLLASDEIDAVYIALSNHLHAQWCIEAAKAKKHILVEKPMCLSSKEALQIQEAVQQNGVHILEGVMTQHHPWESHLRTIVLQKHLGELTHIKTRQTFRLEQNGNYRFCGRFGGGVFFDESCYWLRLLQSLDLMSIEHVDCEAGFSMDGDVDATYQVNAFSKNGAKIEALFSYDMPYEATHNLIFTEGSIRIRNFLAPSLGDFRIKIEIVHGLTGNKEIVTFDPDNYFLRQLDFFSKVITGCQENIPLSQSVDRISLMEEIYSGAGVCFI